MIDVIPFADIIDVTHLMCEGGFSLSNPINGSNLNPTTLSPVKNPNCSSSFSLRITTLKTQSFSDEFYTTLSWLLLIVYFLWTNPHPLHC